MTELWQLIKALFPLEDFGKYLNRKFDLMRIYPQPSDQTPAPQNVQTHSKQFVRNSRRIVVFGHFGWLATKELKVNMKTIMRLI